MAIDERRRLELADAAKRAFGDDAGITLMELLPPIGWADVARKDDLEHLRRDLVAEIRDVRHEMSALELRLEARFERGFRRILVTVMSLMVTGFIATIVANLAA